MHNDTYTLIIFLYLGPLSTDSPKVSESSSTETSTLRLTSEITSTITATEDDFTIDPSEFFILY